MQIIEQKENVHYVEKPRDKELTSHLREALKGRRSMPPVSDLNTLDSFEGHDNERRHYCDGQSLPMLQLEIENLKTTINLCSFCIKSMNKLLSRKRSVIEAIDEVDKPMIDRTILWREESNSYDFMQSRQPKVLEL